MAKRNALTFVPVGLFVVLVGFLAYRLELIGRGNMPNMIPSVMINKPTPTFHVPSLIAGKPDVTSTELQGRVTLVNIFASWCAPCRIEHPYLTKIKEAGIAVIGINYKDQPDEARAWLEKMGDPYVAIGSDRDGRVGIDFGAYGVPESYLIDKQGVIRYKQTGPLTPEDIRDIVLPMAKELSK